MTAVITGDGYRCARCTMTYRRIAGKPRKAGVARCPECQMVFWHGATGQHGGRAGVEPGELVA
jgi:hypothetical protein